jgi:hypothetical protein
MMMMMLDDDDGDDDVFKLALIDRKNANTIDVLRGTKQTKAKLKELHTLEARISLSPQ